MLFIVKGMFLLSLDEFNSEYIYFYGETVD